MVIEEGLLEVFGQPVPASHHVARKADSGHQGNKGNHIQQAEWVLGQAGGNGAVDGMKDEPAKRCNAANRGHDSETIVKTQAKHIEQGKREKGALGVVGGIGGIAHRGLRKQEAVKGEVG
jgi:hypothetical protein